jgi:hypothetical protein
VELILQSRNPAKWCWVAIGQADYGQKFRPHDVVLLHRAGQMGEGQHRWKDSVGFVARQMGEVWQVDGEQACPCGLEFATRF